MESIVKCCDAASVSPPSGQLYKGPLCDEMGDLPMAITMARDTAQVCMKLPVFAFCAVIKLAIT